MKPLKFLVLLVLITACQTAEVDQEETLCQTVHRYGVPLEPQDWSERGKDGQIVSLRKDGVTVTRSFERGILHGECAYSFPNRNEIQKKETYDQGSLLEERFFYVNGLPQQHFNHLAPQKVISTIWYENGVPHSIEEIDNGSVVQGEYYNPDYELESSVNDSNGLRTLRTGLGELQSLDTIENGHVVTKTTLHPNGSPATVTSYQMGSIEGKRKTYLPAGEPATVEDWSQNVRHGPTIVYEQGEKKSEVPFVKGLKHGVEKCFRDEKTVVQEIPWVKGEVHGPVYSYVGNKKQEKWYFRGRPVANQATFDMLSNQ